MKKRFDVWINEMRMDYRELLQELEYAAKNQFFCDLQSILLRGSGSSISAEKNSKNG